MIAEATSAAFAEILDGVEKSAARKGATAALEDYVLGYLSQRHVERPALGCPIAAFGADVGREGAEVRAAFYAGVGRLLEWIEAGLSLPEAERTGKAIALLSMMVGAIITARASGNLTHSRKVLAQARQSAADLAQLSVGR